MKESFFDTSKNILEFLRLLFDVPCIILEWTDNLKDIQNNTLEDLDPLPYNLCDSKMIETISEYFNQANSTNQQYAQKRGEIHLAFCCPNCP